ncbi:MAG: hypothetical protein ACRD7E_17590 [Bryobacteraceae bacterium]
MRILSWALLVLVFYCLQPSASLGAEKGASAEYVGGTVASLEKHPNCKINITDEAFLRFLGRKTEVRVSYSQINLIEYGQKVDRRYAMAILVSPMFLLSKKRQHYLTIGYTDEEGDQQAAVFKVDKGQIRSVLVSLEARTGQKIQYQDGEARKAGKG